MSCKFVCSVVICVLATKSLTAASMLSWLTGSSKGTTTNIPSDLGTSLNNQQIPLNPYPEETGECAHWGNVVVPQYSPGDPTYSYMGYPGSGGTLIGSHKRVPVGSIVAVTNMKNGNTVQVRIVPPKTVPITGRVMDLSPVAFSRLALLSEGVFLCSVKVIQAPRTDIASLTSHTFDNGIVRKPPAIPSSFVPTAAEPSMDGY